MNIKCRHYYSTVPGKTSWVSFLRVHWWESVELDHWGSNRYRKRGQDLHLLTHRSWQIAFLYFSQPACLTAAPISLRIPLLWPEHLWHVYQEHHLQRVGSIQLELLLLCLHLSLLFFMKKHKEFQEEDLEDWIFLPVLLDNSHFYNQYNVYSLFEEYRLWY